MMKLRLFWILAAGFAALIALSLLFEGPRSVYAQAIRI